MGIDAFSSVHDAYGTHAANMNTLGDKLRDAFVKTHEVDVLGLFRQACLEVLVPVMVLKQGMDPMEAFEKANDLMPEPLSTGKLDLNLVRSSPYFFA